MDAFYEAHDDDNDDNIVSLRPKVKPSSSSAISTVAVVGMKRKREDIPPSSYSSSSSSYSAADSTKREEKIERFTAQHNAAFSTAEKKHHDALFETGYVDEDGNPTLAKFKALIGLPYSIGVLFPKYWVLENDRDEFVAYLRWKHHQGSPFDYTAVVKKLAKRLCSLSQNGESVVVVGVMNSSSTMSRMTAMIEAAVEMASTDQISHVDAFTRPKKTEINPTVHKAYGRVPTTTVAALADHVELVAETLELHPGALARLQAAGTVVVVDDVISTGGTLASYGQFLRKQTVDPKKLVFCGMFETNDRSQLSSCSLADIFKQIFKQISDSHSSSSIDSSSSGGSVSSTKIGSCSPSQAKEILKKRNYSNTKDTDNKIAEILLQHLPTEVYDKVKSGTHPRSWGRIVLSPYDNVNTANYIISIVFQSLGTARRCLEFCKNNHGHGVSAKTLEVFAAGIEKLNGLPDTTPFSFDYIGLESGGRYLAHWAGTLMFDRAMEELSESEKLGKHAAQVEVNLLVSTQQVQNIAASLGVDALTVRQIGESLFSSVFQTNTSNGGGNVGTTGMDFSYPAMVLSTGVKLLGMRLLSVLQLPQTPESTEEMKALVYAAVPGLHVSTGNVFLNDSISKLDLPCDTSSGVIHSLMCSDSGDIGGDIVKDLCYHSTDLDPELLSLTLDAFLEDMSSRAAGVPSNNSAHKASLASAKLWLNENGFANSPSFAKDAAAAAVYAACLGGGNIGRELFERGKEQSDEMKGAATSGYSNGGGKAGAFISVRNYQEKNGKAHEADSIFEASAAAVYAACSAGSKKGGTLVAESEKEFASTIKELGGKNKKIKGLIK